MVYNLRNETMMQLKPNHLLIKRIHVNSLEILKGIYGKSRWQEILSSCSR